MPVQLPILSFPTMLVGALYRLQGTLEWLYTPVVSRILTEVDTFTTMIKNGRDRTLQILGKEPDILVTPFPPSDIQWLLKKSLPLCYCCNRIPRTNG